MTGFNSKRDAAADKQKEYDPCPGCIVGTVCRTPKCGRLALPLDHPLRNSQPTQKFVECLDCGSNNVGLPATYDSLVNSVKAQPVQEPVHSVQSNGRHSPLLTHMMNKRTASAQPAQEQWNAALDEAASRIGEIKGFGKATQDSFAIYIRGLKR